MCCVDEVSSTSQIILHGALIHSRVHTIVEGPTKPEAGNSPAVVCWQGKRVRMLQVVDKWDHKVENLLEGYTRVGEGTM